MQVKSEKQSIQPQHRKVNEIMRIKDVSYYKTLMDMSYAQLVTKFLNEYGHATNSYFEENSYVNFVNETSNVKPINNRVSRTSEGLYCHHIQENKYRNMSQIDVCRETKVPFEAQQAKNLVYCNLIEHAILHAKIAQETNFEFGIFGYIFFLRNQIVNWYIIQDNNIRIHEQSCYNVARLSLEDTERVINYIDNKINLKQYLLDNQ